LREMDGTTNRSYEWKTLYSGPLYATFLPYSSCINICHSRTVLTIFIPILIRPASRGRPLSFQVSVPPQRPGCLGRNETALGNYSPINLPYLRKTSYARRGKTLIILYSTACSMQAGLFPALYLAHYLQ